MRIRSRKNNWLIIAVSEKTGWTQAEVKGVLSQAMDEMIAGLLAGKTVELRGVGRLVVVRRKGTAGYTPPMPDRMAVKFRVQQSLKMRVREMEING